MATPPSASLVNLHSQLSARAITPMDLLPSPHETANENNPIFITRDPVGAMEQAQTSHRRFAEQCPRSILEGIPVAVKDVIDTAGIRTTMASRLFADHIPERDAKVVDLLRKAGANIVGKTNAHEFSYGIRGDAGAFGVVNNPHDAGRIAGGSSSGSAAAVAVGAVPLAVGTDTAGSVRLPAALCGVVGFKPSANAISTEGVFPLAPTFDTVGFFASSVQDIDEAMKLCAPGYLDSAAPAPAIQPRFIALDVLQPDSSPFANAGHELVAELMDAARRPMPAVNGHVSDFIDLYNIVRSHEAYSVHKKFLHDRADQYQPDTLSRLQAGANIPRERVENAYAAIIVARQHFAEEFQDNDILISPTVPIIAPKIHESSPEISNQLMSHCVVWNVLGWPAISIPLTVPGEFLPQSVQLIGKPGSDASLLRAAAEVHSKLQAASATLQ